MAGEAFNITDDQHHRFWDFPKVIWKDAGHEVKSDQVWVLPTWMAWLMADVLKWLCWTFTTGTKLPDQLGRLQVGYSYLTHTYRIDKARKSLGHLPVPDFEEGIRKAVG